MYIKKTRKKYKGRVYTNYLLVEAIPTPKGPRQKVICSLGDLRPRPAEEWLLLVHKVEDALVGQQTIYESRDPEVEKIVRRVRRREQQEKESTEKQQDAHEAQSAADDVVSVRTDGVRTEQHRKAGSIHVGVEFWRRLDLDNILAEAGFDERARKITCAMVMNRLILPKSEHAMPRWFRDTAIGDILGEEVLGCDDDVLYRHLDRLHPERSKIETELSERERNLFNLDETIYLYDITSTYFEGQCKANPKAKRGYSRDKRPDCLQVLVGLVVNRDGFPQAHEVFEGNLQDRKTLDGMLDLLDKRVGLKPGQTVVVDRGMAHKENIEQITSRKLNYIVAARQSERDQFLDAFENEEGFEEVPRQPSPQNPFQKKTPVQVKMVKQGAEQHVLCLSDGRREKDRAIRESQEKKLAEDLQKLAKRIESGKLRKQAKIGEAIGRLKERYPRVARYYTIEYNTGASSFRMERNEEKVAKAERLDGSYLLKTNRADLTAEEAWRIYSMLTRAEKAFRDMKSPLLERPIFHQVERRVETHIFLCILAYHLLIAIEKTLLDKGMNTSWATVREVLGTHEIATVVLPTTDGRELHIRRCSTPEPQHRELYELLGVPQTILAPQKKWFSNGDYRDGKN